MTEIDPDWAPSLAFEQAMGRHEPPPPRVMPADAFAAARDLFRRGERLDMVALAQQLGVSRATLYRWTGDRDRLLVDIITAELLQIASASAGASQDTGRARIEAVIGRYLDILAGAPALQALISHEGDRAMRMLTAPRGPIRPRIVQALTGLIQAECDAGHYRPPAPPEILADGIVSLGERYLHNGGDPSLNPDPATAKVIVALLLREQSSSETALAGS